MSMKGQNRKVKSKVQDNLLGFLAKRGSVEVRNNNTEENFIGNFAVLLDPRMIMI